MPYPLPAVRGKTIGPSGPAILFSDDFNRADGALGSPWVGAAFSISNGKATNNPSLGGELLTNPGFEMGNLTGWTAVGTAAKSHISGIAHSGSYGLEIVNNTTSPAGRTQSINVPTANWYASSAWARNEGEPAATVLILAGISYGTLNIGTSWFNAFGTTRAASGSLGITIREHALPAGDYAYTYFDDASIKQITLADLFATVDKSISDVVATAGLWGTYRTQTGIVVNLDSTSSPNNFVMAYLDSMNTLLLEKCVGGSYTTLISQAITYGYGKEIKIVKKGTKYQLFYGGVQIGTDQTISDVGIISNTKHGIFNTNSQNSIDNFLLEAS